MPTILQLRRGTDSQNNSFIGAAGELTFDTSNNTVRAHDGSTLGGHRLATYSDLITAQIDSAQISAFIDSAYIQARQADIFRDSAFVTQIVDSAYIQLRDRVRDSSFISQIVDSAYVQLRDRLRDSSFVSEIVDSDYINARVEIPVAYGDSDVILLVDSAYIQSRQADIFRDSSFVTSIVDEVYIQARDRVRDSSFILDLVSDDFVSSVNNDTKSGDLTFDDDASLKLGTAGNIELVYESGTTNAVIKKTTSGDMLIQADVLNLTSRSGEQYINMVANAGVNIKYDNQTKLKTTSGGIEVVGGVLPQFDGFYSLGSSSKRWKDLWVSGNTIFIGNLLMSADSGGGLRLATIDSSGNVTQEQGKVDPKNLDNAVNADFDSTSQQVLDTFDTVEYRTARYIIQMEQDSQTKYHSTEILLMHDNTNVYMTEYAVLRTDSSLGDITADMIGNTVRLLFTPSYNNTSIKAKRLIIDA